MTLQIPDYQAATWNIDPAHTDVSFSVRYMGMSHVRGKFEDAAGTIVTAENPEDSSVDASVQVASVTTGNNERDQHLRTSDFFDAEHHPQITFKAQGAPVTGEVAKVEGEFTMRGVTKPVVFDVELQGFGEDPWGNDRLAVTARTKINREDFGVSWNSPLKKTGGVLVGKEVEIVLNVSAVKA